MLQRRPPHKHLAFLIVETGHNTAIGAGVIGVIDDRIEDKKMHPWAPLPPRKSDMNTTIKTLGDDASNLAHEVAFGTEQAIRSTQHLAQQGLDGLSSGRTQTDAALRQLALDTSTLAHRGMDVLRDSGQQLREKSSQARQATADYIQHEPLKSVLIAAAVGAGLMGLLALFTRHRGNSH